MQHVNDDGAGEADVMPRNIEAEKQVLGCLALVPEKRSKVIDRVDPKYFYNRKHELICRAILTEYERDPAFAAPVVIAKLESSGEINREEVLDVIRGEEGSGGIPSATPEFYLDQIQGAWKKRETLELAASVPGIMARSESVDEGLDQLADHLSEIAGHGAPRGPAISREWQPLRPGMLSEPPPPRRWLLRHPTRDGELCEPRGGDGLLPLGRAGLFVSEGGLGKTNAVISLAMSVATGRPWFGHFHVERGMQGRRVLLLLGEEDKDEIHRRMCAVSNSLKLADDERRAVEENVVALALAGEPCGLLRADGSLVDESAELRALRAKLEDEAGPEGWALIVLDPLSRFAGVPAEEHNDLATRAVQSFESLTRAPGNPTVLGVGHTAQWSRTTAAKPKSDGAAAATARGVTALGDGFRWVASLYPSEDNERLFFRQVKSNYSRPMPEPVDLVRQDGGVLVAERAEAAQAREVEKVREDERRLDAEVDRVVEALLKEGGELGKKDAIVTAAGMKLTRGRAAVDIAVARGRILLEGSQRRPVYRAVSVPAEGAE